jgi:hypothetical protein
MLVLTILLPVSAEEEVVYALYYERSQPAIGMLFGQPTFACCHFSQDNSLITEHYPWQGIP